MKANVYKSIISSLFLLVISLNTNAQIIDIDGGLGGGSVTISGPSSATINETKVYSASSNGFIFSSNWSVTGGIILSQSNFSASIKWTSAGFQSVDYTANTFNGPVQGSLFVNVSGATAPLTPPIPTNIGQSCTGASLQRGNPPSGVTWYWQGTNANGTSTSNSQIIYNLNTTGRYYLRARNNSTGIWSINSASLQVTFGTIGGSTWYADTDGDGLGDPNNTTVSCSQPSGYVSNSNDQCPNESGTAQNNGCAPVNGPVDQNFQKTIQPLEPITISGLNLSVNPISKLEGVTYFDGFGRAKQSVAVQQSGTGKDIIQHIEYDQFGRASKNYLALPTSQDDGYYVSNAQSQIATYYQNNYGDQHPFSEIRYEASPMNRKLESSAPGDTWQLLGNSDSDHTTKYDYQANVADEVMRFDINESGPFTQSYYNPEELLKNVIKNENWTISDGLLNTKELFTDKNGRKVAEFSYVEAVNGTVEKLSTYYVYDDPGNLKYILPPKLFNNSQGVDITQDYNAYWPLNDFITTTGIGGNLIFEANSETNTITIQYLQGIGSPFSEYTLRSQIIKPIDVSLPDMYLGEIMAFNGALRATIQVGEASIADGNLVITRTSTAHFSQFSRNITVELSGSGITQTNLDDLAFQYKYDQFNRQIEQKVPGKDWEYMIYDQLDRPFLTQDANLKAQDKWLFNKYDAFGRVVYTGLYTNSASRASLQAQVDNFINSSNNTANAESRTTNTSTIGEVTINYSNSAFPNTSLEVLTVIYFDDYNFADPDKPATPITILGEQVTNRTKGLLTATWTKTLGANTWSKNYNFYDNRGRVIYAYDKNHLGGYTENKSELDFRGKIVYSETTHKRINSTTNLSIKDRLEYDQVERPKRHYQRINSQNEVLISENSYNELGQLETKALGGNLNSNLQAVDYTYNIRGWITQVNDVNNLGTDVFAYNLKYDEAVQGTAAVGNLYNGNIKQVIWKSAQNNLKKSYAFEYDKLNRFKRSKYRENNNLTGGTGKFETYDIDYDPNGNIKGVTRNNQSGSQMDRLTYTYDNGNKLLAINDATNNTLGFNDGSNSGNDYGYDANGNLISDSNKNITNIEYNYLDLVERVTFSDGSKIEFTYDANGTKLQMKNTLGPLGNTTTTDYLGGFQYTNAQLKFFPTPQGYVIKNAGAFKYVYQYRDQSENNRLSFSDTNGDGNIDPASEILSNTDYYVMGLIHQGEFISGLASNYNYKYQDKEQLQFSGYNMYDFGSRMYDPAVGRWFNPDPQNQFYSPYLAMGNNYIIVVDPDGEFIHLIAAAIGGVVNVISNIDNIDSFGDGLAYFGIGAVAGAVTIGNPVAGAAILSGGNSIYSQYDQTGTVDPVRVLQDATIGAATSYFGGQLSKAIQPLSDKLFSNIGSQIVREQLTNAVTNTVSGFGLTTVSGLAQGQSLKESVNQALEGIPQSIAISVVNTSVQQITRYYANKEDIGRQLNEEEIRRRNNDPDLNQNNSIKIEPVEDTKSIAQFSKSTIDEAVSQVVGDNNKMIHIFKSKHKLETLVNKFGSRENTIRGILNSANGNFPSRGVFNFTVDVFGQVITLRGNVINGVPRIGTIFIR